jgi:ATP-dependent exoDNAse (exonuclease V) alpha subunit
LINGTVGKVIRIHEDTIVEIETETSDRFRIGKEYRLSRGDSHERYQFPLVLSWAITIHKSQSLTLSKVAVSLKNVFSSGQSYVALSRVRSSKDLFIIDCDINKLTNVAYAVKKRLTKVSEQSRTIEDEVFEAIEDEEDDELAMANWCESKGIVDFDIELDDEEVELHYLEEPQD